MPLTRGGVLGRVGGPPLLCKQPRCGVAAALLMLPCCLQAVFMAVTAT